MQPWYDPIFLPPGTVTGVIVRQPGYEVTAAAIVDKRGRRRWYAVSGDSLRPLSWFPEAWRPADANRWRWPNGVVPPSLPVLVEPRLSTIGGPVNDHANDPEASETPRQSSLSATIDGPQWWRDVTLVAYEPMGAVSRRHGEARILRHLVMERSLPLDLKRQRSNAAALADLKRTWEDVYGEEARDSDWVPPMPIQPEDGRDFETVLRWFAEVLPDRREMEIIRARMMSPPSPWMLIGDEVGVSGRRARQVYVATIDALVAAGNRRPRLAPARIAAVQERNRAARRQA